MATKKKIRRRRPRKSGQAARPQALEPLAPASLEFARVRYPVWQAAIAAAIIVVAGTLVYSNTFNVPEIFDDSASISRNTHIVRLWPLLYALDAPGQQTTAGRPVLALSLAVNYKINTLIGRGGLDMKGFHIFNLTVHLLAGLTLMGVVRRTLLTRRLEERFARHSGLLAGICALLWVVHPLQTESVTYTIQRAESMVGLCYLLTLYCAIRSYMSSRKLPWCVAAALACAVGMATKEVMATAPLVVLIYDRVFVARSFREVAKRWRLYLPLAATWLLLAGLMWAGPRSSSTGAAIGISQWEYAQSQCKIILHYIRLAFWPDRLVLDYYWRPPEGMAEVAPYAAVLFILLVATVAAIRHRPEISFLGVWFFVILGPTSSFYPIKDLAFEHRMYLSLAAIVCGVVLALYAAAGKLAGTRKMPVAAALLALAAIAGLLGWRSFDRNLDYASRFSIWKDTVEKVPHNPRAHNNVGYAYREMALKSEEVQDNKRLRQEYFDKAMYHYNKAIELDPRYIQAYNNRGAAHGFMGEHDKALADFNASIRLNPTKAPMPYCNRGFVYLYRGQGAAANKQFEAAARDYAEAKKNFDRAIEIDPKYARAYVARGRALTGMGLYDQALKDYDRAKYLQPHLEEADDARNQTLQLKAMLEGPG